MLNGKAEQPVWTGTANGAKKRFALQVRIKCGSVSITTPVSLLANEFDVGSTLHGQVSLETVNHILCDLWGYKRLQKSKDSLKACFENVNSNPYLTSLGHLHDVHYLFKILHNMNSVYSDQLAFDEASWWVCLLDLILYIPVNNFSVMSGQIFLDWTSTKQGFMCLAQGHKAVMQVRLKHPTHWSSDVHSSTEPYQLMRMYTVLHPHLHAS